MSPILLRILQLVVLVLLQAALLFGSAGDLRWSAGWWYIGLYVIMLVLASVLLIPGHKDVVEERSRGLKGGKGWDHLITQLMIIPTMGTLLVAGFDERWNWVGFMPPWLRILGGVLFTAGYALTLWAMFANPFFSQTVRIQSERGHKAVTGGPYHFVRHPGYLGMATSLLGAVFMLGSLWGFICFGFYIILIAMRTSLEDRTLQVELPGYRDYASLTRFRLIPGLW